MTIVLVVDPISETRSRVQADLLDSNQFERVLGCESLPAARAMLSEFAVSVMLLDAELAADSDAVKSFNRDYPTLGVVILQDSGAQLDLQALGAHAQTSRSVSPMELIASVAKAMVDCLRPGTRLLRKLLKD